MIGDGIRRYGPAQLPDFAFAPNGAIKPLEEYMGMRGLVGHPTPVWDTYLFAGGEHVMRYNTVSTIYGYGDYELTNSGCYIENRSCSAQITTVWQLAAGFWHDLYKGNSGDIRIGLEDSITRREAFSDILGDAPHSHENILMTSFRYYPF